MTVATGVANGPPSPPSTGVTGSGVSTSRTRAVSVNTGYPRSVQARVEVLVSRIRTKMVPAAPSVFGCCASVSAPAWQVLTGSAGTGLGGAGEAEPAAGGAPADGVAGADGGSGAGGGVPPSQPASATAASAASTTLRTM